MEKNKFTERRAKLFYLRNEDIVNLLQQNMEGKYHRLRVDSCPKDAVIGHGYYDMLRQCFAIFIYSDEYDPVNPTEFFPEISVNYTVEKSLHPPK